MARINVTRLTETATDLGARSLHVQQDPAVQKKWSEARRDVTTALVSVAELGLEIRAAWRRADANPVGAVGGLLA